MKLQINENGFRLWLSATETAAWATEPGKRWPCSELAGRRLFVAFDARGLSDLTVNGRRAPDDLSSAELNAIVADFVSPKLSREHPAFFVAIGQFERDS